MREKPLLQKHPVVMLPTNEASKLTLSPGNKELIFAALSIPTNKRAGGYVNQHLYTLSNEEIKEGDWCINKNRDTLYQLYGKFTKESAYNWDKVIATTDPALHPKNLQDIVNGPMGKLPTDFILAYTKNYNAGTPIKEILVEYNEEIEQISHEDDWQSVKTLSLRSDGSIIIHPVKKRMFTEEEMYMNMQYYVEYCSFKGYVTPEEWIKNHKCF